MKSRGFSLIEMIITVAILSILLTIGTLRFQEYLQRYRTEAQTHLLYAELLKARTNAIYQRKGTRVKFYQGRFEVYSSQVDGPEVTPLATHLLSYPITSPPTIDFDITAGGDIDFDERGVTYDIHSLCLQETPYSGAVDSIVIHNLRTSIGKKDKGDACTSDSITLK